MNPNESGFQYGESYFLNYSIFMILITIVTVGFLFFFKINFVFALISPILIMTRVLYKERVGGIALDKFWVANIRKDNNGEKYKQTIKAHLSQHIFGIIFVVVAIIYETSKV